MKKSIILVMIGVLSLTIFSFATGTKSTNADVATSVQKLIKGNYYVSNLRLEPADEEALNILENSLACGSGPASMGFFVRCDHKCCTRFTHATIAGGGCCNSLVETPSAAEMRAGDQVRAAVDQIMEKYM